MKTEKEVQERIGDIEKSRTHLEELRKFSESQPDYSEKTRHMFEVIDQAGLSARAMLRWVIGYEQ